MGSADSVNILLVDDDRDLLETIADLFEIFGFNVATAGNGLEALAALEAKNYQIVISDIRMPKMDGYELLREIKQKNVNVPKVLLISGFADYSRAQLFDQGVDGFFAKPFNASNVKDTLNLCLKSLEERWAGNGEPVGNPYDLQRSFPALNSNSDLQEKLRFGRVGFSIRLNDGEVSSEGQWVNFHIDFEDGNPLIGSGVVEWTSGVDSNPSIGILIRTIQEEYRNYWVQFFTNLETKSTIPAL